VPPAVCELSTDLRAQSYYALSPDTEIRMLITLTATYAGQVLPERHTTECLGVGCTLGSHVLLPVGPELAAELMADEDDVDAAVGPDAARWAAGQTSTG
jgi:hypothetical protein